MVSSSGGVTNVAFPLYDTHGNMVATVARSGSGFAVGDVRTYDVWGGVRTGVATGRPKGGLLDCFHTVAKLPEGSREV